MSKILILTLIFTTILTSCSTNNSTTPNNIPTISTEANIKENTEFIDKFIFLGESTTYHLKSRGVLSGGTQTTQVWAPKSGTLMLDTTTYECRIIFPETHEELEFSAALAKKHPEYIMFTFGLNGASNFIAKGKEYFFLCYKKLTDVVKNVSPETTIFINSCFPVAKNMDMSNYKITAKDLNSYIDTINEWAYQFAIQNKFIYINTASVLKNTDGFLDSNYQATDGYHLNTSAYKKILEYINNHQKGEKND